MKIVATADLHGFRPELQDGADLYIIAGDILADYKQAESMHSFLDMVKDKKPIVWVWGNHDWLGTQLGPSEGGWDGYYSEYKVWASPWSNMFGYWAFMKEPEELTPLYESIPEGTEIIVSHQPPYGAGDKVNGIFLHDGSDEHVGNKDLRAAIERVKPKIVFCGHIHEGFGEYMIGETRVLNVSHVNSRYQPVHPVVEVEI